MIGEIRNALSNKVIDNVKDEFGRIIYEAWKNLIISGIPPLILTKSQGVDLIDYKIYGESVQNGTPTSDTPIEVESVGDKTSNLFDISNRSLGTLQGIENTNIRNLEFDKYYVGLTRNNIYAPSNVNSYSIVKNVVTVEANLSYYGIAFPVKVKPNTTYSISELSNKFIGVGFYTKSGEYIDNGIKKTFTTPENCETITIVCSSIGNNSTYVFENIQVEEGETATEYEPYGYKIPVKARGNNAFTYKALVDSKHIEVLDENTGEFIFKKTSGQPDTYIYAKPKTQYYISYKVKATKEQTIHLSVYYTDGSNTNVSCTGVVGEYVYATGTTRSDKTIAYIKFAGAGGLVVGTSFKEIQIEETAVTEYEPYVEPVTTNIYLDEPLRKIGEYADYIDYEKGKVIRLIQEDVYNGTEEWMCIETTDIKSNYYALHIGEYGYIIRGVGLSTHFETKNIGSSNTLIGYSAINSNGYKDSRILIRPDLSKYNTITLWKEFLDEQYVKGTPLTTYYVLETPIEEEIELPNIPTIKGTTILEVDTTITPSNMEVVYKGKR